jgi:hypothetical protein
LEDVCVGCQEDSVDGASGKTPWTPAWSGDGDTLNSSATIGVISTADPYPDVEDWEEGREYTVNDVVIFEIAEYKFLYDSIQNHKANVSNAPNGSQSLWTLNDRVDGWWPSQNLDYLIGNGEQHGKISRPVPNNREPPFFGNATAKRYIIRMLELLEFSPYFNTSHFVAECFSPTTSPLYHERKGGVEQCFVSLAQQTYIKTYNISHVSAQSDTSESNGISYTILGEGSDKMPAGVGVNGEEENIPILDVDEVGISAPQLFNRTDPGYLLQEFEKVLQLFR